MGTPQWTRFSPLPRTIEQICRGDLTSLLVRNRARLETVNELGIDPDNGRFGDISAPFLRVKSLDQALELSVSWMGVALQFRVETISENIVLNLWPMQDVPTQTVLCLYTTAETMWMGSDQGRAGEWLLEFQSDLVAALLADCSGYGSDDEYDFVHEPLDPQAVLERLRHGSLFEMNSPSIHLLSSRLVSRKEIRSLMSTWRGREGFQHRETTAGYHAFWNFGAG